MGRTAQLLKEYAAKPVCCATRSSMRLSQVRFDRPFPATLCELVEQCRYDALGCETGPLSFCGDQLLCVYNHAVIFSLEILNLYWDSLPFRGGSNFSLRINWKRIKRIEQVSLRGWVKCSYQPHQCLQWM